MSLGRELYPMIFNPRLKKAKVVDRVHVGVIYFFPRIIMRLICVRRLRLCAGAMENKWLYSGFITMYKEVQLCSEHISQKKGNALRSTVFVKECQQKTGARFLPAVAQKAGLNFPHS